MPDEPFRVTRFREQQADALARLKSTGHQPEIRFERRIFGEGTRKTVVLGVRCTRCGLEASPAPTALQRGPMSGDLLDAGACLR